MMLVLQGSWLSRVMPQLLAVSKGEGRGFAHQEAQAHTVCLSCEGTAGRFTRWVYLTLTHRKQREEHLNLHIKAVCREKIGASDQNSSTDDTSAVVFFFA